MLAKHEVVGSKPITRSMKTLISSIPFRAARRSGRLGLCRPRPFRSYHASEYLADAVKRAFSLPRSAHDIGVSGIAIDEQHLDLLVFALRKKDVAAHREVLAHFVGFECDRTDLLIGLIVR